MGVNEGEAAMDIENKARVRFDFNLGFGIYTWTKMPWKH